MRTLKILKDYDFHIRSPRGSLLQTFAYRAGEIYRKVPEAQAVELLAAGAAEAIKPKGGDRAKSK